MGRRHVAYELTRMAYLAIRDPREGGVFAEAALEAGLVHARVLAALLGSPIDDRYRDQIVAGHYFVDVGEWSPVLPFDAEDYRHLHKRIVHLSTARLTSATNTGGFRWDQKGGRHWWAGKVLRGFAAFHRSLKAVAPERSGWFDDGLTKAKTLFRT